jgi:hypothetical protein
MLSLYGSEYQFEPRRAQRMRPHWIHLGEVPNQEMAASRRFVLRLPNREV